MLHKSIAVNKHTVLVLFQFKNISEREKFLYAEYTVFFCLFFFLFVKKIGK